MANDGTGATWDTASPADSDDAGNGALEVRDIRKGVAIRANKEHVTAAAASVGGEHLAGSAKAYKQDTAPTVRPDTSTALSSGDAGRLWVKTPLGLLEYWDGSAWQLVKPYPSFAILQERKSSGVSGGTFTGGDWRIRVLNTEVVDADGIVTLNTGTGVFTLTAGTYRITAWATGYKIDGHKITLNNDTDGGKLDYGSAEISAQPDGTETKSVMRTVITLAGAKALSLQHFGATTRATDGMGNPCTFASSPEIYSEVFIEKLG